MLILYRSTGIPTANEQLPCQSARQHIDAFVFIDIAVSLRGSDQGECTATGKFLQG
jgi:hypothetical protein